MSIQLKSLHGNIPFYLLHTRANAHTYIYLTAEQSSVYFISRYGFNSLQPLSLIVKGKYWMQKTQNDFYIVEPKLAPFAFWCPSLAGML